MTGSMMPNPVSSESFALASDNPMVLGVHDGHTATLALLAGGVPVAMASEERFTRVKNAGGPPVETMAWLRQNGLDTNRLNGVAVAGLNPPLTDFSQTRGGRHALFEWLLALFPASWIASDRVIRAAVARGERRRRPLVELRARLALNPLPMEQIRIFGHHHCHAAAAFYGGSMGNEATLVLTLDGSGDGESMSVWEGSSRGLKPLGQRSSYHSIGILYSRMTELMGMKPWEHEYKVMGLAPYGGGSQVERAAAVFRRAFRLTPDGLFLENTMGAWGRSMLEKLHRELFGLRFDAVCAGLQGVLEELVVSMVLNWVRRTGLKRLALGGGVFMNVKLNKLLAQHPEIDALQVLPSCGDESVALGAAYLLTESLQPGSSRPLDHLYLGPSWSSAEVEQALQAHGSGLGFRRVEDVELETARLLADNAIVGRFRGRAEWGARALGNRSILCHPSHPANVPRLNHAIKQRDFWMPFCPSILEHRQKDYLVNPRGREAPFMILAFDTQAVARKELPCGLHPYDHTARPQIVTPQGNPRYHRLLSAFEQLTGVGGVLNTSFNLHGYPIVHSPEDCLHVFRNSELDHVTIEDWVVWRA